MKLKANQKGFTLVELLIVIVVIAILAAISVVAYSGITNRANKSSAMEAANAVKSVASAYNGANNGYPTSKAQFVSGGTDPIAKLPADITFVTTAPTAAPTSPKTVMVVPHGSPTTGFTITYWDYQANEVATMTVGEVTGQPAQTALAN